MAQHCSQNRTEFIGKFRDPTAERSTCREAVIIVTTEVLIFLQILISFEYLGDELSRNRNLDTCGRRSL
jgi:hypothetical protein